MVTIGINRPEARNAVNQETAQRLLEEFAAFDGDPDLTVAILHGIGEEKRDGFANWPLSDLAGECLWPCIFPLNISVTRIVELMIP